MVAAFAAQADPTMDELADIRTAVSEAVTCLLYTSMVSKQWFVKMAPLAGPAIEAVRSGSIRFVPERSDKNYFFWMENTRDWCISRQLWWGHRIPAYYLSLIHI